MNFRILQNYKNIKRILNMYKSNLLVILYHLKFNYTLLNLIVYNYGVDIEFLN